MIAQGTEFSFIVPLLMLQVKQGKP